MYDSAFIQFWKNCLRIVAPENHNSVEKFLYCLQEKGRYGGDIADEI